jgi:hypothetical protein
MFWMHRYLRKVPALGFDPRLQEFVETVFTQTIANVGFILIFVVLTDDVREDSYRVTVSLTVHPSIPV